MSKLVIVESPAKTKSIKKYLGAGFDVMASVGHVRDLPKSNKDAVDVERDFKPKYVTSAGKEEVIAKLKAAAEKSDEVFLATDPDREGEAIAWHIKEALGLKNPKRIVFHEITREAVLEAFKHPRSIDMRMKTAQEARRVLDRLVGYDLSGLIWKKVRYGLSAGRVQSPALRILMEREREIRKFIPETYHIISADLKATAGKFIATAVEEPKTLKETEEIVAKGKNATWSVADVIESKQKRSPKPPFITSTLQQVASTRLGFSPSRTMRAAQKLYEAGHITYMRTDSTNISAVALPEILATVAREYGDDVVEQRTYTKKSKNAQEAHEAIRPTNSSIKTAGKNSDEERLYELIRTRTLASQMKDAQLMRTKIIAVADVDIPQFTVTGSRVVYPGWLRADTLARGEDVELPPVQQNDPLNLIDLSYEAKETEPPRRYTEAGLVKELEKRGIGRPSTYAAIMRTLEARGYVEKQGRTLFPTDTGDVVSSFLEEHFGKYISDTFTATMEDDLDAIAEGKREYAPTIHEIYDPLKKEIEAKEDIPKLTNLGPADTKHHCPKCDAGMHFKLGRGGIFMSCDRYPDCDGMRTRDGEEIKDDEPIGKHPDTGEDIFVLHGRFGPYVQLGTKDAKNKKPRRASLPKDIDPKEVTVELAAKLLLLPRELGTHPETGEPIVANIGRFGPYIVHQKDFRSLKDDDVYTISLERALEILSEPKKPRKGVEIVREVGIHPKTKKPIVIYKSKSGIYLKKGLRNVYLPEKADPEKLTVEEALEIIKNS